MSVTYLVLCFSWFSFFAFWGAEKHVLHISPFCTMGYVLMRLKCLDVSNRVKNWYRVKNFIFVGSKLHLCQTEIPIIMYKLMCQISLCISVFYVFCEFNRGASWNKSKAIIKVRSSFQISQLEILVSYSSSTYVNINMTFPNSNFEGYYSTYVFGKSFWHYRELKSEWWTSRHLLCEEILNYF